MVDPYDLSKIRRDYPDSMVSDWACPAPKKFTPLDNAEVERELEEHAKEWATAPVELAPPIDTGFNDFARGVFWGLLLSTAIWVGFYFVVRAVLK